MIKSYTNNWMNRFSEGHVSIQTTESGTGLTSLHILRF